MPECSCESSLIRCDKCPTGRKINRVLFERRVLRRKRCLSYIVNDAVDFVCGSPGAGEGLDVGRRLSHRERSNQHDEEHLKTHTLLLASFLRVFKDNQRSRSPVVTSHREDGSYGVLSAQDEGAAVPEGQSVGQVDHEEGEAHGDIRSYCLLYSHVLSIHQILIVSVVQTHKKDHWLNAKQNWEPRWQTG